MRAALSMQDDNTTSAPVSLHDVETLESSGKLKWNLHASTAADDRRAHTDQPNVPDADCPSDDEENGWSPEDDRHESADEEAAESDDESDAGDDPSGTVQTGVADATGADDTPDLGLDGGHCSKQRPDDDDGRCSSSSSLNGSLVEAVRQLRRKILPTLRRGKIVSAPEGYGAVNVSEHTHARESVFRLTRSL